MSAEAIEPRVGRLEEFAADVRKYTQILTEMVRRHDERIDTHDAEMSELREAQANADARIAALADAQIRTDEALKKLIDRDERRNGNGDSKR